MQLDVKNVSAVIVTRGDVDLQPVLDSLIFDDVVVFDNSKSQTDLMTFGRVAGARLAKNEIIYSQDDDLVHPAEAQRELVAAYEEGMITGCMWDEWSRGAEEQGIPNGYDDLVFPGSGSISHRALWEDCIDEYLAEYPYDDFFKLWCDTIIGVIAPSKQLDIRFQILPAALNLQRMADLPNAEELKGEAIRRARGVRDGVPA